MFTAYYTNNNYMNSLSFLLSPDLTIERFCMTGGESPIGYLKAYMTNLYLSKDSTKVQEAIEEGWGFF